MAFRASGWAAALIAGSVLAATPAHAVIAGTTGDIGDIYPPESLKAGEQGTAAFEVDVDATGKVTACRITRSSGFPRLDAATCALMSTQAHFTPKHDRHGNPIAGRYRNRIVWKIPQS